MATTEHRNHARAFLTKAEEYLASDEDNLAAERYTPAAGNAIHAGISAKDAIVTAPPAPPVRARIMRPRRRICGPRWANAKMR